MKKNFLKLFKHQRNQNQKGALLIYLIISLSIFSILMVPILDIIVLRIHSLRNVIEREQALQIAEAGVNYYQWHLAHFPQDYQDGTGQPGPYVHDYIDAATQEKIGQFSLMISPPPVGSSIITIQSTGWTLRKPNIKRTITVQFGIPSLTKYAFLSHWHIWVYPTDSINGRFMVNGGLRFEGSANAPVECAKEKYICGQMDGCLPQGEEKPGIWGNPLPPDSVRSFWKFPVPSVDFSALTSTLSEIEKEASKNGIYLPPSNAEGYSLVFNSDGTVTIYKVLSRKWNPVGYTWVHDVWKARPKSSDYDKRTILSGYDRKPLPSNGLIFVKDDIWVEGVVKGRVTVAAAKLGETNLEKMPSIYIPNNLVYSKKDGSDVLGLIAQRDIIYTFYSPTDLEVDAAQIAQNGATQILFYGHGHSCPRGRSCPQEYPYIHNSITTYGSIMSYDAWVWTWSDASGDIFYGGYTQTYNNYDYNLLYAPPPGFPLSSSGYQQLSWKSD